MTAAFAKVRFSLSLFGQIKEGTSFRPGPARCGRRGFHTAISFSLYTHPERGSPAGERGKLVVLKRK